MRDQEHQKQQLQGISEALKASTAAQQRLTLLIDEFIQSASFSHVEDQLVGTPDPRDEHQLVGIPDPRANDQLVGAPDSRDEHQLVGIPDFQHARPAAAASQAAFTNAPAAVYHTPSTQSAPQHGSAQSAPQHGGKPPRYVSKVAQQHHMARQAQRSSREQKFASLTQRFKQDLTASRILAILGAAITIIGLTFLAALALSTGFLSPRAAVIIAAVLCAGFVGAGVAVRRSRGSTILAPSLVIVGVMGGLADTWISVFGLDWIPATAGAILTTAICAVGAVISHLWRHEILAIIVTALSPLFITPVALNLVAVEGYTNYFAGSVAATALIGFAVRWGKEWIRLNKTATATYIVGILLAIDSLPAIYLTGLVGFGLLALLAFESAELPFKNMVITYMTIVVLPVTILIFSKPLHALMLSAMGTVLGLAIIVMSTRSARFPTRSPQLPGQIGPIAPATAAESISTLFNTAFICFTVSSIVFAYSLPLNDWRSIVAAVLLIAAVAVVIHFRRHFHPTILFCMLIALIVIPVVHAFSAWVNYDWVDVPAAAIVLAATTATLIFAVFNHQGLPIGSGPARIFSGLVALVIGSAVIPAVFQSAVRGEMSYMIAQLIISVLWISLGIYALKQGNTPVGLGLAIAACLKLVFWDLSILGGLVQVVAFVMSGILLLVAAGMREKSSQ